MSLDSLKNVSLGFYPNKFFMQELSPIWNILRCWAECPTYLLRCGASFCNTSGEPVNIYSDIIKIII